MLREALFPTRKDPHDLIYTCNKQRYSPRFPFEVDYAAVGNRGWYHAYSSLRLAPPCDSRLAAEIDSDPIR